MGVEASGILPALLRAVNVAGASMRTTYPAGPTGPMWYLARLQDTR
jgi:hypothetical protein